MLALAFAARACLAGNFYAGTSPTNVPWPGGVVPYEFTNTLSAAEQQTYLDGLREWELAANVQFVPHTNQSRWILFDYNTNFLDFVATGYSPQLVSVSSLSRAQVCHEMGHSFGFTHENIRPDKINYILVLTNNIANEPSNIYWFTVDPTSVTNGSYDFESVMHLGWDFVSSDFGVLATQQPRPPYFPRYQYRMGNLCLSPGDRAALAYLYHPPAVPLTNVVTTTADFGPGSLRAALYYVTDNPGAVVQFNIPTNDPAYSNGVFNIHLTGHLPPLVSKGMAIDGSTQPGFAGQPLIFVDGSQIIPQTATSNSGLLIYSAGDQVKNVSFSGFNWNGLTLEFLDATNNTVSGCWLGVDSTGTNPAPNAFQGILFSESSHNLIGGTNAGARNVISGNTQYGLWMADTNTTGNTILGNYIGTDPSGSLSVPNLKGGIGIIANGVGHVIGGANAAERNIISGNSGAGIFLSGAGVSNNVVCGNYVGLNAAGTAGVPNVVYPDGIHITSGASSNAILDNVISSNDIGVFISDDGTRGNVVQGNLIGTDSSGTVAVGNGYEALTLNVGAISNLIGGTVAGASNVISGSYYDLVVYGPGTVGNVIQGNLIGSDITGGMALPGPFQYEGLTVEAGASSNLVGGTAAGAANVISGSYNGVVILGSGTSGNIIEGNHIGTDTSGKVEVPGIYQGLVLGGGATANTIGGTASGARNIISGNYINVVVDGQGTSSNVFEGNFIGVDITGETALTNQYEGFVIDGGAMGNTVGGTVTAAANVISGNYLGLYVGDTNTSDNLIEGNLVGVDITGANAIGNDYINVEMANGASANHIGGVAAGAGNVIAYSGFGSGVALFGTATTNNSIRGNSIFSNSTPAIYLGGFATNHTGFLAGPNDLQNYPVITNAYGYGARTVIAGTLNGLARQTYYIDIYRNVAADPSGFGQGQFYAGAAAVTTDGSGNASFALTNTAGNYSGQYFSATATSAGGDTSQFGPDVVATNLPAAFASFSGPLSLHSSGFVFVLTLTTNFGYHIQAATNLATNPIPWINLTNFVATNSSLTFTDRTATGFRARFYRVVSP